MVLGIFGYLHIKLMKRILLVDDEQQAIDVFHAALTAAGYEIVIAQNAKTALDICQQQAVDLIIADEMMPDMSGNDLIKTLRSNATTAKVPIIVLTNYSDDNLVKEAMTAGANDYILKYQMIPDDLAEKVKKLIGE